MYFRLPEVDEEPGDWPMEAIPEHGGLAPDYLAPNPQHAPDQDETMSTTDNDDLHLALHEPDGVDPQRSFEWLTNILLAESPNQSPDLNAEEAADLDGIPGLELPPSIVQEKAPKPKFEYHARARRRTNKQIDLPTPSLCSVQGSTIVTQPCSMFSAHSTALPVFDEARIQEEREQKKQRDAAIAARKNLDHTATQESRQSRSRGAAHIFSKPSTNQRGARWANLRFKTVVRIGDLLKVESNQTVQVRGFLNDDMFTCLWKLAEIASVQVFELSKICDNSKMPFASAPFWGFALAQEAFMRNNGHGKWIVETEEQQYLVSWEHMEAIYEMIKKTDTRRKELHDDPRKEDNKSKAEKELGVWRTVVSHELGSTYNKMYQKMKALHDLLVRGGDKGLDEGIMKMALPNVMRYPRPPPSLRCVSNSQQMALLQHSIWSGSSRKRAASGEPSSSASATNPESAEESRLIQEAARAIEATPFSD